MSPRHVGSGTATGEANACARMLAALISGDRAALSAAQGEFSSAADRRLRTGAGGGRGYSANELVRLLGPAARALQPFGRSAVACGPGEAGDVVVECRKGAAIRVELKAQLTLANFRWIQSADWIRGETDFLGALVEREPAAQAELSAGVRDAVLDAYQEEAGWNLDSLWVADVAGLTNQAARHRLGVMSPGDLRAFLVNKFIVHVTQAGLRMFRMSEIPNLTAAFSAGVTYRIHGRRKGSQLGVWTRGDGGTPKPGGIHLTYYLAQNGRPDLGGHHLHEAFFARANPLVRAKVR